jgi:hypothetical protein
MAIKLKRRPNRLMPKTHNSSTPPLKLIDTVELQIRDDIAHLIFDKNLTTTRSVARHLGADIDNRNMRNGRTDLTINRTLNIYLLSVIRETICSTDLAKCVSGALNELARNLENRYLRRLWGTAHHSAAIARRERRNRSRHNHASYLNSIHSLISRTLGSLHRAIRTL